jgi:hypothetical protein
MPRTGRAVFLFNLALNFDLLLSCGDGRVRCVIRVIRCVRAVRIKAIKVIKVIMVMRLIRSF